MRVAADRWDVDPGQCDAADGFVIHGAERLGFGRLAEAAAGLEPGKPVLRRAGSGRLAGQSLARLDLPAKSDGSLRFAADVRLPDMLFASIRMAPPGGRLRGFSRSAAEKVPGLKQLVATDGWLAAISETWWAAERALVTADARFTGPADSNNAAVEGAMQAALEGGERRSLFVRGEYEEVVGSGRALAATYRIAPAEHLSLEPMCATARFAGERLEVWAPVQAYDDALGAARGASGAAYRLGQGRPQS